MAIVNYAYINEYRRREDEIKQRRIREQNKEQESINTYNKITSERLFYFIWITCNSKIKRIHRIYDTPGKYEYYLIHNKKLPDYLKPVQTENEDGEPYEIKPSRKIINDYREFEKVVFIKNNCMKHLKKDVERFMTILKYNTLCRILHDAIINQKNIKSSDIP